MTSMLADVAVVERHAAERPWQELHSSVKLKFQYIILLLHPCRTIPWILSLATNIPGRFHHYTISNQQLLTRKPFLMTENALFGRKR